MKHGCMKTLWIIVCVMVLSSVLTGCSTNLSAQGQGRVLNADEEKIDEEAIFSIVKELTSEKYLGRKVGTKGNDLTADYIADYFKRIGLENPKGLDNYMQYYTQPVIELKKVPKLGVNFKDGKASKNYEYINNFTLRSLSSETNEINISAPIYIVEYIDDIKESNKDIQGKMLLISDKLKGATNTFRLISQIGRSGAAGAITELDLVSENRLYNYMTVTPMNGPWLNGEHAPFIYADNKTFKELVDAASSIESISFQCSFSRDDNKKVPNVAGLITGSNPELKDQCVIISAHFDHVGDNLNGTYNSGALDNASGTAVMMEIARMIKQNKAVPEKSILFIAFNGEEAGLLGSTYYTKNPLYPLKDTVVINFDMVGSKEDLPLNLEITGNKSGELQDLLGSYAEAMGLKVVKENRPGSDHTVFGEVGVPAVTLINVDSLNGYHSPDDTIEDLDKLKLEKIAKVVLQYTDENVYKKESD